MLREHEKNDEYENLLFHHKRILASKISLELRGESKKKFKLLNVKTNKKWYLFIWTYIFTLWLSCLFF